MRVPQLDIRSTPARLDISTQLGRYDIRQKMATMDIRTTQATIEVKTELPVVKADMTKTWDALDGGGTLSFMSRIYNQFGQFVNEAIVNTVQEYDQIGDATLDYDPIPELAKQSMQRKPPKLQLYGEASPLNLTFDVQITDPEINITPGGTEISVIPNRPEINYQRGGVKISMAQYPSVQITPPQIDLTR
ncbi:DUF6470 family protein [Paenibacillus pinisoli]|nr:DUF6470 family protein [Paenibacillus pinisoli]